MMRSLRGMSFLVLGITLSTSPAGPAAGNEQRLPRPSWLGKEPIVIVGNWDSMPIFRRRVGGGTTWQEEDYLREHSEETVKRLKDMGVTMAVIHFYKGFGLEAEKEHLALARQMTALCKQHGLRVGVYVGSTIGFETFLHECPEAVEWFAPHFLGRPVLYGSQTFRKRVYFMHPGYRAYMKRVLRLAVEDLKADLIHFDNTSLQAQAPVFLHPQAVQDFREFLRTKHPPETLKRRLGHSDVTFIEPPAWDRPMSEINDPLFQEWADFRCRQLTAYYAEMERFIRGLNPEVAVESNPHSGLSGRNTVWEQGIDYPRLLSHMDVVWTEEGNEAGVTADGILVSKIRTYKMAALLGNSVFTYTGGSRGAELQLAEAMAYNRQNVGMVGGPLSAYDLPEAQRKYLRYYHKNFDKYVGIDSVADVAVLHSYASMAFNNDLPWQSTMLVEQALIQAKVPFDIIFDAQLKDLSKYRVLVLANQECLTDAQMSLIRDFVSQGGGLAATERSSLFTRWRLRRRNFGLKDLFQVDAPRGRGAVASEANLDVAPVRNRVGRGRVAYIPNVRAAVAKPATVAMTSRYWKLPRNWEEIIAEVKWAAGGRFAMEVAAPLTVTAELTQQEDKDRWLVHLLNYDVQRSPTVENIEVSLLAPPGKQVEQVSILSPDQDGSAPAQVHVRGGRASFSVPLLRTYSVAVVRLR
jgi:hypothetical protein